MKLFISYAHVDSDACTQIVELFEPHEVWYDERLYVGDNWWDVIVREVENCEGFVFLVSPESLASSYCQQELQIAIRHQKYVFPVIVKHCPELPDYLRKYQYVDMQDGQTADSVKELLNAILIAERRGLPAVSPVSTAEVPAVTPTITDFNPETFSDDVADAMDQQDYDRAVLLLQTAVKHRISLPYVDTGTMLVEAREKRDRQVYERAAERHYRNIVSFTRRKNTRRQGCEAFHRFRQKYPDYDPDGIASMCARLEVPLMDWCDIPEGEVMVRYDDRRVIHHVPAFQMSKYPVTNAQYQMFVNAEDGYSHPRWWDFMEEACRWRTYHPKPLKPRNNQGNHPRVNVSWYEAMAFCNWMSERIGQRISLPTEAQWQRAAQGDTDRQYPWGNRYQAAHCNTAVSAIRRTTPVTKYPRGRSPYGVVDMAGNVWEWCNTARRNPDKAGRQAHAHRVLKGGSYSSPFKRARIRNRIYVQPGAQFASFGFRVMAEIPRR